VVFVKQGNKTARVLEKITSEGLVSRLDTSSGDAGGARERLEYIDIGLLDDDPKNFYSMEGIDKLADNIELVGLQQPLRVRESGDGRFVIVSGHRRRAAVQLTIDNGHGTGATYKAQPRDSAALGAAELTIEDAARWRLLPCIVEADREESEALRELKLIYANADTRKLSGADAAKQAERVEALLYELKSQGMEFPGRMREHVAEACRLSESKLARLRVIREKLSPVWLDAWEREILNESCAYAIAQLCDDAQKKLSFLVMGLKKSVGGLREWELRQFAEAYDKLTALQCPKGFDACTNVERALTMVFKDPYVYCVSCCKGCHRKNGCKYLCACFAEEVKLLKAEERAVAAEGRRTQAEKDAAELAETRRLWRRLGECVRPGGWG
jgi:ParB family chromosome partitioning protein